MSGDPVIDSMPPISMSTFGEQAGLSPSTLWRFRQKGWLQTINISGRQYISRAAIADFNRRAESGEFSGEVQKPNKSKS